MQLELQGEWSRDRLPQYGEAANEYSIHPHKWDYNDES